MSAVLRSALIAGIAVLAFACGPSRPPTISAFTATPDSFPYGGGNVTLSWEVSEDMKSLRIDPGVGEVSGRTGSIEAGVAVTTTFTLTATNEKGDSTSEVTVTVATITNVSGRVVGQNGAPAPANTTVFIPGKPTAFTDTTGAFVITDVTPPYDVAVVNPANTRDVHYYKGITRADPTLTVLSALNTPLNAPLTGTLTGTFSTGAAPGGFTNDQRVRFESQTATASNTNVSAAGTVSGNVAWATGASVAGTAHAIQWRKNLSGEPDSYLGYAAVPGITLTNGNTHDLGNVALASVTTASISGTFNHDTANYAPVLPFTVRMAFGGLSFPLATDLTPTTAWSYLVPNSIGGSSFVVLGSVRNNANNALILTRQMAGLPAGTSNLTLDFPAPPQPTLPSDNATGVTTSTVFEWSAYGAPSALYLVTFTPSAATNGFRIITTAPSTVIPDLTAIGKGLPAGIDYTWKVEAYAPFASVNEAVAPAGLANTEVRSLTAATYFNNAGPRTFTTAP